jgi:hypothetical protein
MSVIRAIITFPTSFCKNSKANRAKYVNPLVLAFVLILVCRS